MRRAVTVAACAAAYVVGSLMGYQAGWHRLQGPPVLDRWRPVTRPPARVAPRPRPEPKPPTPNVQR